MRNRNQRIMKVGSLVNNRESRKVLGPPVGQVLGQKTRSRPRSAIMRSCGFSATAVSALYFWGPIGLSRLAALKAIRADIVVRDDVRHLLAQNLEGKLWATLKHPNIVAVYAAGADAQVGPYLALEYIDGRSLREELGNREGRRFSPPDAVRIIAKVAGAIAYAHEQGVFHRDLKPANIMLDQTGNPYVTDFGLAVHEFSLPWKEGEYSGTWAYMAPEQRQGRFEPASDVWSLGAILYELLAGKRPDRNALEPPSQFNAGVGAQLDRICLSCLEESPDRRLTAKQFAEALQRSVPASAPGVLLVPQRRNPFFTGRIEILRELRKTLGTNGIAALSGLGGCGKTQIAVAYVYRHQDAYHDVFWVSADTQTAIHDGFLAIARELGLPEKSAADPRDTIEAVKRWLESNPDWLLVFDNVDDPVRLGDWLPSTQNGHVVVTTRAAALDALGISQPIRVSAFSRNEAIEFLGRRLGPSLCNEADHEAAEQLAAELGDLPLALEQAGAYITAKQARLRDYLASFRRRRLELLGRSQPVAGNYPAGIATAWSLNFQQVEEVSAASADLLRLSAFLHPDEIPVYLVVQGSLLLGPEIADALQGVEHDPVRLNELLAPLARYSLIDWDPQGRQYSMHPLIQEVVRESLDESERSRWVERVVRAVEAELAGVPRTRIRGRLGSIAAPGAPCGKSHRSSRISVRSCCVSPARCRRSLPPGYFGRRGIVFCSSDRHGPYAVR